MIDGLSVCLAVRQRSPDAKTDERTLFKFIPRSVGLLPANVLIKPPVVTSSVIDTGVENVLMLLPSFHDGDGYDLLIPLSILFSLSILTLTNQRRRFARGKSRRFKWGELHIFVTNSSTHMNLGFLHF